MKSVFLSYSGRDKELAEALEKALEARGIDAINPQSELDPEQSWRSSIKSAIRNSDAIIALVTSPYANASSHIGYELGMADALNKKIMVVGSGKHSKGEYAANLTAYPWMTIDPDISEMSDRSIGQVMSKLEADA